MGCIGLIVRGSRFLIIEGIIERKAAGHSVLATTFESFAERTSDKAHTPGESPRSLSRLQWIKPKGDGFQIPVL